MNPGFPRKRIRQRLVLHILLVGLLPLALGLGLTYHYGIQALRSAIGANFEEIAIETGRRIDSLIADEIRKLRNLATVPIVVVREVTQENEAYRGESEPRIRQRLMERDRDWIERPRAAGSDDDLLSTESSRYLKRVVDLDDRNVIGILIADRYGGLVSASTKPTQYYFGDEAWWQAVMRREDVYVSAVLPPGQGSFETLEGTIEIALPIRDPDNHRMLGVAMSSFGFSNLVGVIAQVRIGQSGHAMLFDSDGTPLICTVLPPEMHGVKPSLLEKIRSSTPGWLIAPDDAHGAQNTIVGYAPVAVVNGLGQPSLDGRSWHVFIRQHPDESYASAYALLMKVGVLGGILVGMLALSGFYVGSRITRPIDELQRGVKLFGEGRLDHRIQIQTGDEVEELAGEFNWMAEKIRTAQEEQARWSRELESKVEERTEELKRSEKMRREAYAQVMHAEKLASLGRMAAGVAHEIGNPLSSISAIVQVLQAGKVSPEEQTSYLSSLKQLVDRIDRIIRSLLTFSRPSPPKMEILDLDQVIDEAIRMTTPDARFKTITLDRQTAQDPPKILGDHIQLVQVFMNLLLNAADAVAAHGSIAIETSYDRINEQAVVLFSDNGHGIPPEALSVIFDPFFTTKPQGKGTGLGLSICRRIIEGLGGRIAVESEVGKGTRFSIRIPAVTEKDVKKDELLADRR